MATRIFVPLLSSSLNVVLVSLYSIQHVRYKMKSVYCFIVLPGIHLASVQKAIIIVVPGNGGMQNCTLWKVSSHKTNKMTRAWLIASRYEIHGKVID